MRDEVLRMDRVDCYEQGILYLRDVNLQIFSGEIMGLLAVSRSGLRTLIRLLCENIPIQRGFIYYREQMINSWHGAAGRPGRICVIDGNQSLVSGMTVADNIFVLRAGFKSRIICPRLIRQQLTPELQNLGLDISPDEYVEKLSPFHQIAVELLKAVMGGCRLIILREISTFIGSQDIQKFHQLVRHFAEKGVSFLYIGYFFEELQEICDRTALLVSGTVPKVLRKEDCRYPFPFGQSFPPETAGLWGEEERKPVFEACHLTGDRVKDLSFSVAAGECIVIRDRSNQIFGELMGLLSGERPLEGGSCRLGGEPFRPGYTRDIAFIPEQPSATMVFPDLSVLDNLCFSLDHRLPAIWRNGRMRRGLREELSRQMDPDMFSLHTEQLTTAQKYDLVYGRIRLQRPRVVFCIRPFQGADMDLRGQIRSHLEQLLAQGCGVVILAGNLTDTLSLAHQLISI